MKCFGDDLRWPSGSRRPGRRTILVGLLLAAGVLAAAPGARAERRGRRSPGQPWVGRIREVEVRLSSARREGTGTVVVIRLKNLSGHEVRGNLEVRGTDADGLDHAADTYSYGSVCERTDFDRSFSIPPGGGVVTCRKILHGTPRLVRLGVEVTGEGWAGTPKLDLSVPLPRAPGPRRGMRRRRAPPP